MKIVEVLSALREMQEVGVIENYAIGGAVGAAFFLEPAATVDVDVFIHLPHPEGQILLDSSPVFAYLRQKGHELAGEYVVVGGWPVQFLSPPGSLGEEALAQALEIDVEGVRVKTFSPEYLAAICLQAGRAKDKARLLQFFEEDAINRPMFVDIVRRHGLDQALARFEREFLENEL